MAVKAKWALLTLWFYTANASILLLMQPYAGDYDSSIWSLFLKVGMPVWGLHLWSASELLVEAGATHGIGKAVWIVGLASNAVLSIAVAYFYRRPGLGAG